MAKGEVGISAYVPPPLAATLENAAYDKGVTKSNYVRDILLDHFSKGDEDLRRKLLGREKMRK